MERQTAIHLKFMVKERGLKGYSKLRKAELVEILTPQATRESTPASVVSIPASVVSTSPLDEGERSEYFTSR